MKAISIKQPWASLIAHGIKDIDIFWYIEQKMKYNELRPFMHGGKAY